MSALTGDGEQVCSAAPFFTADGRLVFRLGTGTIGLTVYGEFVFGLPVLGTYAALTGHLVIHGHAPGVTYFLFPPQPTELELEAQLTPDPIFAASIQDLDLEAQLEPDIELDTVDLCP